MDKSILEEFVRATSTAQKSVDTFDCEVIRQRLQSKDGKVLSAKELKRLARERDEALAKLGRAFERVVGPML